MKPSTLMRRIVDGLDPAPCVLCDGFGPPSPCYGGVRSGYTTCAKCYASDGPSNRDCFVAMPPAGAWRPISQYGAASPWRGS